MADPETIYNWRRLDGRITTSGQPTEPQLADIHAHAKLRRKAGFPDHGGNFPDRPI
jgi:hypothetical protein